MDFVDYGDGPTSPQIRDTSPRYFMVTFIGISKRRNKRLIKSRFTGSKFPRFGNELNITLQTIIPGYHQSWGETESGNMYFKGITQQILDKRKNKRIETVDWGEYDVTRMAHLKSKAQHYGCYTPDRRVSWRAPKFPIGKVDIPHFRDFTNIGDSPCAANTRCACAIARHSVSLFRNRFAWNFNLSLSQSFREMGKRRILFTPNWLFLSL